MDVLQQINHGLQSAKLSPQRIRELLHPGGHDDHFSRHRADVIISRLRMAGLGFGLLTLLWIPLDALLLPWPAWGSLAVQRLISAFIFFALAWPWKVPATHGRAMVELLILLLNPMLFFALSQWLLLSMELGSAGQILMGLYTLLPFVVLAGLSLFPLTAIESILFALPIVGLSAVGPLMAGSVPITEIISTAWIMLLAVGVYALAGVIQLHYMLSLVNRVMQDALTGAFTRHTGQELVDLYFLISIQHDTSLSLVLIDPDNLGQINEAYGQQAGDEAMREAVTCMSQALRRSDMVIRWSGETFLVLMANTDTKGVKRALQKIMADPWLGKRPDGKWLTASIGVSERIEDEISDWPQMVELVHERMWQAKKGGKGQAVISGGEVMKPQ
ncbi:GGDEF domain-containing protein [Magnetococcus sp. PR-3]|uniref:GGDEF domain-containing protein n=1 Tax=Magnetococcus sp. PR-3 TaxID=3120355 RepID=UPI002FCE3320